MCSCDVVCNNSCGNRSTVWKYLQTSKPKSTHTKMLSHVSIFALKNKYSQILDNKLNNNKCCLKYTVYKFLIKKVDFSFSFSNIVTLSQICLLAMFILWCLAVWWADKAWICIQFLWVYFLTKLLLDF